MQVEKVEIVSISYGAPAGILFTQRYPESVGKLVVMGAMKSIPEHLRQPVEESIRNYFACS